MKLKSSLGKRNIRELIERCFAPSPDTRPYGYLTNPPLGRFCLCFCEQAEPHPFYTHPDIERNDNDNKNNEPSKHGIRTKKYDTNSHNGNNEHNHNTIETELSMQSSPCV